MLSKNEPQGEHHRFFLAKVFLESHNIEHPYHSFQGHLHPDGIAPSYTAVFRIEKNVVLTYRPPKSMVCILRSADFQQNCPLFCIHNDVEDFQETGSPCVTPLSFWNGHPKNLPAFGTTFCLSQYRCSNLCRLVPRPPSLSIYMNLPLFKDS